MNLCLPTKRQLIHGMCNLNIFIFKGWSGLGARERLAVFLPQLLFALQALCILIPCFQSQKIPSHYDCILIYYFGRHKLTRHQYYMQLRRDILEDRLPYTEETGLYLSALALQAEFGDILPEVMPNDCK